MSFHQQSEPTKYTSETLKSEEMLFNLATTPFYAWGFAFGSHYRWRSSARGCSSYWLFASLFQKTC